MGIHLLAILWIGGCIVAGWWQISRALDGNGLSYLYAVEWPIFAVAGTIGWWALLHTAPATPEQRAERSALEEQRRARVQASKRRPEDEDDALRAYNDHLARLAGTDPSSEETQ